MATPNSISSRGIQCVVGTIGKKPPPGAGAAQCGNGDVGVVGGEGVVEGSARKTHAEWRTALRLSVEQAGEEHRFRCRLSPPDRLARTDQPGKIERFGRYGDRSFSCAAQRRHLRRGRNSRRVIRSLIGSAENSAGTASFAAGLGESEVGAANSARHAIASGRTA